MIYLSVAVRYSKWYNKTMTERMQNPSNRRLNRRNFVHGTLALGVLGALGIYFRESIQELIAPATEANLFLDTFPEKIPGASRVWKMKCPGAKFCLAHIRQVHDTSRPWQDDEHEIEGVQDDIEKIIEYLMDAPSIRLRKVYLENMKDQKSIERLANPPVPSFDPALTENAIRLTEEEIREVEGALRKSHSPEQQQDRRNRLAYLQKQLQHYKDRRTPEVIRNQELERNLRLNAAIRLKRRKRLSVLAGEDPIVAEKAADAFLAHNASPDNLPVDLLPLVYDAREEALLLMIQKSGETCGVTIFGGNHHWEKVIKKWNKQHPDAKFSLIEMTPDSYDRAAAS